MTTSITQKKIRFIYSYLLGAFLFDQILKWNYQIDHVNHDSWIEVHLDDQFYNQFESLEDFMKQFNEWKERKEDDGE